MDGTRRTLALMMTMTIVAGFAFLFVQTATPAAKAEENGGTHLGWLGGCFPPVMAVGRYYPGDAPCHPRETVSLAELQQEFNAQGLIKNGEHLEYAPQPRARALTCWGLIKRGDQATGWVCSDGNHVYRTGMDGKAS